MIIVGDIASPTLETSACLSNIFKQHDQIFGKSPLICNFEGLIDAAVTTQTKTPILFNHPSVINALKSAKFTVGALANNHTLDLPHSFSNTIETFKAEKIHFIGAGNTKIESEAPCLFTEGEQQIKVYNFCWSFLLYNSGNPKKGIYVAEQNEESLLEKIKLDRKENPNFAIVVYLHWSFDLETLPFPMYRQFAKDLIENGANVVVGAHSHCVQGGEKHLNGYIVYGLGNFFIPYNTFAGSYLTFPDWARTQLALEWNPNSNKAICHWFKYQNSGNNHTLIHVASEAFEESQMLQKFSPYIGMTQNEYIPYFKKHRRKKKFVPSFNNYKNHRSNFLKMLFLKSRARFARQLAKFKIIGWQH